jgi:toxin secretion/phage lysis holin
VSVTPLLVSVAFIVFDVLTGWLKAAITATLNSSIMRTGLLRKLGEILSILFGYVCQYSLPYLGLEVKFPFAGAIGTYIVLMETASIIENLCAINPNMREALSKVFDDNKLPVVKEEVQGKHERKGS